MQSQPGQSYSVRPTAGWQNWWTCGFVVRLGRVRLDICPSALHRPLYSRDNERGRWMCFGWGDGGSDPLWSVEIRR